jgi:hypothetical protein
VGLGNESGFSPKNSKVEGDARSPGGSFVEKDRLILLVFLKCSIIRLNTLRPPVRRYSFKNTNLQAILGMAFLLRGGLGAHGDGLKLTGNEPEQKAGTEGGGVQIEEQMTTRLSLKGPWGQLETFEVLLEAPADLLRASEPKSVRTRWFFGKMKADAVAELIRVMVKPETLADRLCDRDRWLEETEGISVFPRTEDLVQISTESRVGLYRELAKFQENFHHVEPEILYGSSFEDWLKGSEVGGKAREFIKAVSYRHGSMLQFSDIPALLGLLPTEKERIDVLRALSRTPSLVAKIIINSTSTENLSTYWHKGFRLKDTSAFMASIKRHKEVDRMDLLHLLPSGIRRILYTFPDPTASRSGYLPDCHWSSLNFFNTQPLDRLADPVQATAYTLEKFTPIEPPYELGDVLFFTDIKTGDAYHSCAYLADDVVFTKNGRSPLQPWVLMRLESVKELYDMHFNTKISAYRRKDMIQGK